MKFRPGLIIQPQEFWETCRSNYAHLKPTWEITKGLTGFSRLKQFNLVFLDLIDFKGKTIIDYGCGGGFLGKYLAEEKGIKRYIGIDIADRSLIKSEQMMRPIETCKSEFYLSEDIDDFAIFKADMFITVSCIQHFPDKEYLDDFLQRIDQSGIEWVILHIKLALHGNNAEFYNNYSRPEKRGYGISCKISSEYIGGFLPNYESVESPISQYTIWRLKGE